MFKGPVGPVSGRTPRSQAEAIGTDSSGFKEGPAYDVAGGHPITKQMPKQAFKAQELKSPSGGAPMEIPAPFTLGSK